MNNIKKSFLLLLVIPLYLLKKYLTFLFYDVGYNRTFFQSISLKEIIIFALFIISATLFISSKERLLRTQLVILLHIILFLPVLINAPLFSMDKKDLLIYTLGYLPTLLFLALLPTCPVFFKEEEKTDDEKLYCIISEFTFYALLLAVVILFTVLVIKKQETIRIEINYITIVFALLFFISVSFHFGAKKYTCIYSRTKPFLRMLAVINLFYLILDIIWIHSQYIDTFCVLLLPLIADVIIYESVFGSRKIKPN